MQSTDAYVKIHWVKKSETKIYVSLQCYSEMCNTVMNKGHRIACVFLGA